MTYFLIQSAAMFLVAYFAGCWFGCLYKTLATSRLRASAADDAPAPIPAPVMPRVAPVPPAAPRPAAPARAPAAVVQPPAAAPAPVRPVQPPTAPAPVTTAPSAAAQVITGPGSRVSPELTAAAAAAAAAMAVRPAAATISADDLKRIKGIGPEIERKLNAMGVRRFSEIAGWTSADVARVNREIGQDGRVQHENWIEQAQILGRGGETAFSRRVDRREVTDGAQGTWTPTAPNDVARQAAAGAAATTPTPTSQPVSRPAAPAMSPAAAASGAAAAAAAAAIAGMSGRAARQPAPPPPAVPVTAAAAPPPVQPAKPVAPPATTTAATTSISMRPAAGSGNQRRFVRLAAPEGRPDDLALIGGVGDKIAGDLNRYGIYHYWQLAAMGPDDIDYLESRLSFRGRMRREEWPEQARELMAGKPPRARTDRERGPQDQPGAGKPPVVDAAKSPVVPPAVLPVRPAQISPVQTPPVQAVPAVPAATIVAAPATVTPPSAAKPMPPVAPAQTVSQVPPPAAARPAPPPAAVQPAGVQSQPLPQTTGPATGIAAAAAAVAAAAASAATLAASRTPAQPASAAPAVLPPAPPVSAVKTAAVSPPPAPVAANPLPPADTSADPASPGWTPRSRPLAGTNVRVRDDLKRIKGIGVVIEKRLEAMGITSYTQIAAWATPEVDQVSNALDFKGRIEREQWVQQARILSGGGQTDFSRRMDRGDGTGV